MYFAIYTFHSGEDYSRAFTEMIKLKRELPAFGNHVSFELASHNEYHVMTLTYLITFEDAKNGCTIVDKIRRKFNSAGIRYDIDYPSLADDWITRKWMNVELDRSAATIFKDLLDGWHFKYESSECYDMIHIECYINDIQKCVLNGYLDNYLYG